MLYCQNYAIDMAGSAKKNTIIIPSFPGIYGPLLTQRDVGCCVEAGPYLVTWNNLQRLLFQITITG